jgi:tetratricopeptide (TPR) repeat protein
MANYRKALELDPGYTEAENNLADAKAVNDAVDKGLEYYNYKDYDNAIAEYNKALNIFPHYAEAQNGLAAAQQAQEAAQQAQQEAEIKRKAAQQAQANKETASSLVDQGNTYYNNGDYDSAIDDYTRAIALAPNNAVAYYNRGLAYGNNGDLGMAIADLTRAIQFDPSDDKFRQTLQQMQKYVAAQQAQAAQQTQADAAPPVRSFMPTDNLIKEGNNYFGKGDYDDAISYYTSAIEREPNYALAYNNRGRAYANKGDYANARADLEKALQLDPNNKYAQNGLNWLQQQGH